jgi:LmbE family N-acetylglucosaminyl deacetylase
VGGTIARFAEEGHRVCVAVMTKGRPPQFQPKTVEQTQRELKAAHKLLGVWDTIQFDFPAAELDKVAHREINTALESLLTNVRPCSLFLPFGGDIHLDHQLIFHSALVAARPNKIDAPMKIFTYETLSETNWHAPFAHPRFVPSVFVDISNYLDRKLEALNIYRSQLKDFPHERSIQAVRALATLRGATIHRECAEAFMLVRLVM